MGECIVPHPEASGGEIRVFLSVIVSRNGLKQLFQSRDGGGVSLGGIGGGKPPTRHLERQERWIERGRRIAGLLLTQPALNLLTLAESNVLAFSGNGVRMRLGVLVHSVWVCCREMTLAYFELLGTLFCAKNLLHLILRSTRAAMRGFLC